MTQRSRVLGLLLEGEAEKPPHLVQSLIGLHVRRVRDVLQSTGGGYHVVGHSGEAQGARSPYAGVIVITRRLRDLLPCEVLTLALELYLGSL
jgi:hypothetical protein